MTLSQQTNELEAECYASLVDKAKQVEVYKLSFYWFPKPVSTGTVAFQCMIRSLDNLKVIVTKIVWIFFFPLFETDTRWVVVYLFWKLTKTFWYDVFVIEFEMMQLKDLEMLLLHKDTPHGYSQPYSQTSRTLSQNLKDTRWGASRNLLYSLQDNWKRIWVMALWLLIMAGLFMWKCAQYKRKDAFHVMGYCLVVAKGAAETLKFNMALILLPVCRITITYLRSTALSYSVPFDDSINFHKVTLIKNKNKSFSLCLTIYMLQLFGFGYAQTISVAIFIGMLIHASSHLACDFPRIVTATDAEYKSHLVHYFGVTRPTYFDLVKGPVGITGFIMVIFMVIAFALASRRCRRNLTKLPKPFDKLTGYNAFWYSHHLLLTVYVLLIIHGVSLYLEQKWYRKTVNSIKLFTLYYFTLCVLK